MKLAANPLQFAVVREDPRLEETLLRIHGGQTALLIGSGGCTAFHLQATLPGVSITVVDRNPAQLDLILRKLELLSGGQSAGALASIESGNFEALFRRLREFLWDFVAPREEWIRFFRGEVSLDGVFDQRYWRVAFELHFHTRFLLAMFGPDAIQHAPPDSYPAYFEKVLREGLLRRDAPANPFLQHIFLGQYLNAPDFYQAPASAFRPIERVEGSIAAVPRLDRFDLISLSNIFDWMDEDGIRDTARRVQENSRPGAVIVIRQLNHSKDFKSAFQPGFDFDADLESKLLAEDRSLFYSRLSIGVRK